MGSRRPESVARALTKRWLVRAGKSEYISSDPISEDSRSLAVSAVSLNCYEKTEEWTPRRTEFSEAHRRSLDGVPSVVLLERIGAHVNLRSLCFIMLPSC